MHRDLTQHQASLQYLHDTKPSSTKSDLRVFITLPEFSTAGFAYEGKVEKVRSSVLPLIFFNSWKSEMVYSVGEKVVQEDIKLFLHENLLEESQRSGIYVPDTTLANSKFTLEIEVDSLSALGPYRIHGFFLFMILAYSYSSAEYAGPGMAYSRFTYRFKEGDKVLFERTTENKHSSQPLTNQVQSVEKLRDFYTTNLIESLSATFKANIEQVVADVNHYLRVNYAEDLLAITEKEYTSLQEEVVTNEPAPLAKLILYRRDKKQENTGLPVLLNDSLVATIHPNEYYEMQVPIQETSLCIEGTNCITFTPILKETNYISCSLPTNRKNTMPTIERVEKKVGEFYVQQIQYLQTKK